MCNRYVPRRIDIRRLSLLLKEPDFEEFTEKPKYEPSKNQQAQRRLSDHGGSGAGGSSSHLLQLHDRRDELSPNDSDLVVRVIGDEVKMDYLKWGLIPPYEPEPKIKYATFNAQSETITTKPAYRNAWTKRQRCLIPMEAFFEWKGDKPPKQKYRISVKGQPQFCAAGLWEKWERDGQVLETYTIITCAANELVAEIHDKKRMPVILRPEDYDRWLHDPADVTDLLKPFPTEKMEADPIASNRKSKREEGPSLFG
jgi:putative SOS response-associated peptidase YedK